MSEPNFVLVDPPPAPAETPKRITTKIKFPYADLDSAVAVAKKIYEKGGTSGETAQVAAWLGHNTVDSGAFRLRTGAAQTFGLITTRPGHIELTPLGRQVVDPQTEASARVEAFLKVPLYDKLYDTFKTGMLPKDIGLESEMQKLGVPPKQTDSARQIFARSAKQAGFFGEGADRLVKPVVRPVSHTEGSEQESQKITKQEEPHGGGGDGGGGTVTGESKTIHLRGGGTLTLVASVQFLAMPRDDRTFVFDLIDKLEEYETRRMIDAPKANGKKPTPVEQAADWDNKEAVGA